MKESHKQQDEYVAREFNRAAKGYDKSLLVKSYQRRVQRLVIDRLQINKGINVLDLGCGTGKGCIDIDSILEGTGKIVGMDLSRRMIDQAKQNLAETPYGNIEFTVGSAGSLNYDNYFDCVFSTNAFHHFDQKEDIFMKVWNSLKHNGLFAVEDICNDYLLMKAVDLAGRVGERAHVGSTTSAKLETLFLASGFVNVEIEKVKLNWFWGIMIGKGVKQAA